MGRSGRCGPAVAAVLLLAAAATAAGGDSDCCFDNGSPGCGDVACAATVCEQDPFCCEVAWDLNCADDARSLCGALCPPTGPACPGRGDCCSANATPGCLDATCCESICADDPYCCAGRWDVLCADDARRRCRICPATDPCAAPDAGDCCRDNGSPGCDDAACCDAVCLADAFCCNVRWDLTCAFQAVAPRAALCDVSCPTAGDCCVAHDEPGCDDLACCDAVCLLDPACCFATWDALCAEQAATQCAGCGGGFGGDCCAANGTPGCDDAECTATVCAIDPFCCETEWDQICVDEAIDLCGSLCAPCPTDCPGDVDADGEVDVVDLVLVITHWGEDGSDGGDTNCDRLVDVADLVEVILTWGACGGNSACPGEGDCFRPNGTVGCDDEACCNAVCVADPFCCDIEWDELCVQVAKKICTP